MAEGQIDLAAVEAALEKFRDPETGRSIVETRQIGDLRIENGRLSLSLALTTFSAPLWDEIRSDVSQTLKGRFSDISDVSVEIRRHHRPPEKIGEIGLTAKSVVAVGSGKGGVGKSTIAASLALSLKNAGSQVGLMDADVYGPSIPHLFGLSGRPAVVDQKLQPADADGIRVMSMGFMVPPGEAVVWRGPMLHGAITQFLRDTNWGELDYLIIDMPPGTGDIALTLSQLLPLTGAVVVCTPQDVALLDAMKAVAMFRKVNIPILGMVENMSYFECPDCNHRHDIFGSGGAKRAASEQEVPFLGDVPIHIPIRVRGDQGNTSGNLDDESSARYFDEICHNLVRGIVDQRRQEPPMPSLSVLG